MRRYTYGIFSFILAVIFIAFILYMVLNLTNVPLGDSLDWLIGTVAFIWLIAIVIVPWNIYFEAQEVKNEARVSEKREIEFDKSELKYVNRLSKWSLYLAVSLHLISAGLLYWIAWYEISVVGYFGAGAAVLLTLLRPAIRAYEYISYRLSSIKKEFAYPRNDVFTLSNKLEQLSVDVKTIQNMLDRSKVDSWISQRRQDFNKQAERIAILEKNLEELNTNNEIAHERLSKETRHAVAQLNEDGKFIDNIVEIIRFIKKV